MARALQFSGPGQVEVVDVEVDDPGPGQVVVDTAYSGISTGTELLAWRGQLDPDMPLDETIGALGGCFSYPFRYGYSCVGTVVDTGASVFALHPHQDRFVIDGDGLVPIDGVDPRAATLFPLVETALQITLDAGSVADADVVVTGMGPVGVLVALLLCRAGARVLTSEPVAWRRHVAASLGLDAVAPDDLDDAVHERTAGAGVPLVVEVSGHPAALTAGLDVLAHEGTALVASWYGTKPVTLPLGGRFHRRRLVIRSTQVSTIPRALQPEWTIEGRRAEARRLLDELPLLALATHTFALDDAVSAFRALDAGTEGLLHAALAY